MILLGLCSLYLVFAWGFEYEFWVCSYNASNVLVSYPSMMQFMFVLFYIFWVVLGIKVGINVEFKQKITLIWWITFLCQVMMLDFFVPLHRCWILRRHCCRLTSLRRDLMKKVYLSPCICTSTFLCPSLVSINLNQRRIQWLAPTKHFCW